MTMWSKFLRTAPGHGPFTQLPDCHTAVEMNRPPVIVVLRGVSTDDSAEKRMIGLALQENGVRVNVARIDLDELLEDLAKAKEWLDSGEPLHPSSASTSQ